MEDQPPKLKTITTSTVLETAAGEPTMLERMWDPLWGMRLELKFGLLDGPGPAIEFLFWE